VSEEDFKQGRVDYKTQWLVPYLDEYGRKDGCGFVIELFASCEECDREGFHDEADAGWAHVVLGDGHGVMPGRDWNALVDHEAELGWEVEEAERGCRIWVVRLGEW